MTKNMAVHYCTKRYAGATLRASFFITLLAGYCCGCRPDNKELQLKLAWRAPIFENSSETAESIYPIQTGNQALTAKLTDNSAPVFYALDMQQGRMLWQATDTSCAGNVYYNMKPFASKHGVVLTCGSTVKCMDAHTGKVRWSLQHTGNPEQFLEPSTNNAGHWSEGGRKGSEMLYSNFFCPITCFSKNHFLFLSRITTVKQTLIPPK